MENKSIIGSFCGPVRTACLIEDIAIAIRNDMSNMIHGKIRYAITSFPDARNFLYSRSTVDQTSMTRLQWARWAVFPHMKMRSDDA